MKRLLFILLILCSIQGLSQTTYSAERIVATRSLYVRDWWVDSVRRDTANWQFSPRTIPTSKAVYDFIQGRGGSSYTPTITTSATSITLSTYETYVFTGSSATTFTLPASGTRYIIKSRGSGTLTVSGTIYTNAAKTSITLLNGDSYTLQWDGSYWIVY